MGVLLFQWWRLCVIPANRNELLNLKLSGLGNLCTGNEIANIVQAKDLSVVFIAETWVDEASLKDVKQKIQFENMFVVPREARGGGLVLFWRDTIAVTIEGSDKNHVDVIIHKNTDLEWRFTGFYGELETQRRSESWNLL